MQPYIFDIVVLFSIDTKKQFYHTLYNPHLYRLNYFATSCSFVESICESLLNTIWLVVLSV